MVEFCGEENPRTNKVEAGFIARQRGGRREVAERRQKPRRRDAGDGRLVELAAELDAQVAGLAGEEDVDLLRELVFGGGVLGRPALRRRGDDVDATR